MTTVALTRWTFVGKIMSLLLNRLSRLVIAFLPRKMYPEKNRGQKDTHTPVFTAALFTIAKTGATYMSVNRGTDKGVMHAHSGILTVNRNKSVTHVETRMDPETVT